MDSLIIHEEKLQLDRNTMNIIGERAKRARHSQVCSIDVDIYILLASERSEPDTLSGLFN